jgi:hypothetical protein
VNAQHLLPALNDWLLQSPVLVQAHSYTSSKPKTVNLPFPMESTLVEYASTEVCVVTAFIIIDAWLALVLQYIPII